MGRKRQAEQDVAVTENGDAVYVPQTAEGAPTGNGPAAPKESKAQKWKRLANRRVPRAVKCLRALIPMSAKAQYEYTEEDAQRLVAILAEALQDVKRAYEGQRQSLPPVLFR